LANRCGADNYSVRVTFIILRSARGYFGISQRIQGSIPLVLIIVVIFFGYFFIIF
jgi:hypothetical protein